MTREELYNQQAENIKLQIEALQAILENHKKAFNKDEASKKNWGFIGDLQYVKEKINDITLFMGN